VLIYGEGMISVLPGESYGVAKFDFWPDDRTKKEVENFLIALCGEKYQKDPLQWRIGDRE